MSHRMAEMPTPVPTPYGDAVRRDATTSELVDPRLKKKMAEVAEGIERRTLEGREAVRILESRIGSQKVH